MNCPRCGYKIVGHHRRCENCGQDLRPYEGIRKLSNRLYNEGLALARVRNLSGACDKLKRSLEYNKENIEARNLLGLVYYEMGETVAAIVEWVISTNISKNDNPADGLLEKVQGDANEFREVKSAIKKFNIALDMAKNGNDDLAILQLKKVVDLNDHYVKALLLLALLQIKHGDYESARKHLKRVLRVDVGNLDARRYIAELRSLMADKGRSPVPEEKPGKEAGKEGAFGISPGTPYKEDKPNVAAIVMFILGIIIGVFVFQFFAVHGIREKLMAENAEEARRMGSQITELSAQVSTLESDKSLLEGKIRDLNSELLILKARNAVDYEELLGICLEYHKLRPKIEAAGEKLPEDLKEETTALYKRLMEFDISKAGSSEAVCGIYEEMKTYISGHIQIQ